MPDCESVDNPHLRTDGLCAYINTPQPLADSGSAIHPCSYLIYSQAFDELPSKMRDYVWKRLWDVLVQQVDDKRFAHLSKQDRRAIVDILRATKVDLPKYWTEVTDATGQAKPD